MSKKKDGAIYTPTPVVKKMLDLCEYGGQIRRKHIIDNSCGDGRILSVIVRRYIISALDGKGTSSVAIKDELETYIHGIELDKAAAEQCRKNLDEVAADYSIHEVKWDIRVANSLTVTDFDGKMDFVIGNPPYIRTHDMKKGADYDLMKSYSFASKGSADLYLAFYELGLRMLNKSGKLVYIAPSAWLTNGSGEIMREYVEENRNLAKAIDFGHTQLFENASTYVMIAMFDKERHDEIECCDSDAELNFFNERMVPYNQAFIGGKLFLLGTKELGVMHYIQTWASCPGHRSKVKNGYATLNDKVFIDNAPDFEKYTIPVVKASTGEKTSCFFPYDENLKPVPLEKLESDCPEAYRYIMDNAEPLKNRAYDKTGGKDIWWVFGRSQGLADTNRKKIAIKSLLRNEEDVELWEVPAGTGVYGGLYILTDAPFETVKKYLKSKDFVDYIAAFKQYKSGGYYTFSSKQLETYLNFRLGLDMMGNLITTVYDKLKADSEFTYD